MEKIFTVNSNTKQIGNILLVKTIGKGTFSTVKLGYELPSKIKVAVKILDKKMVKENETKEIQREINILKKLNHPNIIKLHKVLLNERYFYLVMDYIDGDDLFHYVTKKKRLSEIESCKFFHQLISCIEYLNSLNIVHRDIKPENILLDIKKNNIKLIDFGLSIISNGHLLKTKCGSPCFVAPEVIQKISYNGLISDIWSIGIVLYFMLTGNVPFESNNLNDLYTKIISGIFNIPSFLSENAISILKKLLNVDPKNRITISEIKKHPFYLQFKQINCLNHNIVNKNNKNDKMPNTVLNKPRKTIINQKNESSLKKHKVIKTLDEFENTEKNTNKNLNKHFDKYLKTLNFEKKLESPNKVINSSRNRKFSFNKLLKDSSINSKKEHLINTPKIKLSRNSMTKHFYIKNNNNNNITNLHTKKIKGLKKNYLYTPNKIFKISYLKHILKTDSSKENSITTKEKNSKEKNKIKGLIPLKKIKSRNISININDEFSDSKNYFLTSRKGFEKFEYEKIKQRIQFKKNLHSKNHKKHNTNELLKEKIYMLLNNSTQRDESSDRKKTILSKNVVKYLLKNDFNKDKKTGNIYKTIHHRNNTKIENEGIIKPKKMQNFSLVIPKESCNKIKYELLDETLKTEKDDNEKRFINVNNLITSINIQFQNEEKLNGRSSNKTTRNKYNDNRI